MKTFALIIANEHDFFRKKGKVIKAMAESHETAIDQFLDNYKDELLGLTIMTLCFQEQEQMYGYEYSIIKG
ncbi:MAG: hypothetical protein JKY81_05670 [Colwellia sp.]|nr:hypothetical protein [Colwellia sp.]